MRRWATPRAAVLSGHLPCGQAEDILREADLDKDGSLPRFTKAMVTRR